MASSPPRPTIGHGPTTDLKRIAIEVRERIVTMIHNAGSGHAASSLSCADIIATLRFDLMAWDSTSSRDIFVLSKGHAAPAWYAALIVAGDVPSETGNTLRQIDSPLQGHPDRTRLDTVDATTGALGQGLAMAIGRALASRLQGSPRQVWCVIGDGESQEGEIWESLQFAAAHHVDNLTVFLDYNKAQSDGYLDDVMPIGDIAAKVASFGWDVQSIDGHDASAIQHAARRALHTIGLPSLIIANTKKGYLGPENIALEGSHGAMFTDQSAQEALRVLESAR